jgi:5'-3' exonuclease
LVRATVIFARYLKLFKEAGVTPLVVFDGQKLPAKTEENDRRQRYYKE